MKDNTKDQNKLISYGNGVLDVTEKLVSALVRKTDTIKSINISLQSLEVQVIMIGQNSSVNEIPSLITSTASMDIELTGILKNNNGSAAVAFMSYTNMAAILKLKVFDTSMIRRKSMMSAVVSATLPRTTNTHLTTPVNVTFTHIRKLDPEGVLSCVYWKETEWVEDGCSITKQNSTHTVCSCDRLSTFALIIETDPVVTNAVICTITIIILIFTLIRLKNQNLQMSNTNDTKLIITVMFKSLAQFFILGCSWIILFIPTNDSLLYTVFEFISSQQGTFIFLVHCLLNQEVRQKYRKYLCAFCCFSNRNTATADVQVTQGTA
ncbi:adhesion G protein-coupled receptor E2-like [Pangasianodon hypophthalmus]|uniref:adhesion G protein-coupled receptor E2-like n=1 Tax=Pangasianodon hypophthalmus TaxID=310915 RepID=UPI0023077329|nr:adhesion G protein-coupled receptor E2-like [Pangasianodon hypophthalmus]